MVFYVIKIWIAFWLMVGALTGISFADAVHDEAVKLVNVQYDKPTEALVNREIADAKTRVTRMYKDIRDGLWKIDKEVTEVIITGTYTTPEGTQRDIKETRLKSPSDKDVLNRIKAKYESVKHTIANN